jgi:transcriptional regulator with XRE-family HTH domain
MRLLEIRNSKGMTQKQLAEKLGVTIRTITNYENGSREPNIATLKELALIFDTSIDYLVGFTDDPQRH